MWWRPISSHGANFLLGVWHTTTVIVIRVPVNLLTPFSGLSISRHVSSEESVIAEKTYGVAWLVVLLVRVRIHAI